LFNNYSGQFSGFTMKLLVVIWFSAI